VRIARLSRLAKAMLERGETRSTIHAVAAMKKRRTDWPAARSCLVASALFGRRCLACRGLSAAARLFLGWFGIIGDNRRQAERGWQAIGIDHDSVIAVRRSIGHNRRAPRTAATRTFSFVLWRRPIDRLVGLIASGRAIGRIPRRGISGRIITLAIAATGIAIAIAGLARLIANLVTILIPVRVTPIGAITVPVAIFAVAIFPMTGFATVTAIGAIPTVIPTIGLIGIDPVIGHALDIAVEILVITVVELVVRAAARLIFFKARARFGEHAEIMIGKLQIIFGVDPVALHLGIARQRLVFLEQLGRVAAGPIIDAIAVFRTAPRIAPTLRALPATTATAAGLTIVDQVLLSSCLKFKTGVAP